MAREIHINADTGLSIYALLGRVGDGYLWDGSAFVVAAAEDWADYALPLTESPAGSGRYSADMPAVAAGMYQASVYEQAAVAAAVGDEFVGSGELEWDGSAQRTLADLVLRLGELATVAGRNLVRQAAPDYTTSGGSIINLAVARYETPLLGFVAIDGSGRAIDLAGRTLQFSVSGPVAGVLGNAAGESGLELLSAVTGGVQVTVTSAMTATAGSGSYELWDVTAGRLIARGEWMVRAASGPQ